MNNTRFSTALHILTLLADSGDNWVNSDWIAGSININAAMVRKELSTLQDAGFVVGRKGKVGGSMLNKPSEDISLADIYVAVKNSEILGKKNLSPNPNCPVGKRINGELEKLYAETDQLVIRSLRGMSLENFAKKFR
ncbi:Rrf2 family transcriptional regulator [Sphingobacterium faecium]|uniref:Rrf2 family transcriptional regulator n=1 Tax=Sphingobacterium faecium TaxID=34087 RepID=UPI0004E5F161|nr:Rrf2 family transcriptional regulator [Sphingobacterium faecium]UXD71616.1 Rrf2 family transcriptional regulator [Sphingobacterium faecium]CDS95855.1 Rrf2 family protein [Sphingobacterium sp. PM2-P1-29]SJN26537.1 Rrf2 family transcriptional regulator, group III [Sphingobacterium faecium PCAi_F2.5]